jgi:hypothetical protein
MIYELNVTVKQLGTYLTVELTNKKKYLTPMYEIRVI